MKSALMASLLFCAPLLAEDPPTLPHRDPRGSNAEAPNADVSPDLFYNLKPFDIPILQDDDVKGYVGVTITLQATSADNAKKLTDLNPIVRDKILVNIYSIMYLIWQPSYTPDLDSIKRYVEKSIEETLQEDVIDAIYLKDFYFRKGPQALPKA